MVYLLIKLVISLIKAMSTDTMPQQMGVISGNSLPGFGFAVCLPRCTFGILPKVGTCPFPTLPLRARPKTNAFWGRLQKSPQKSPLSPRSPFPSWQTVSEQGANSKYRVLAGQGRWTGAVSTALLIPRAAGPVVCLWSHLMQLLIQLAAFLTEKTNTLLRDVVDPVPCC